MEDKILDSLHWRYATKIFDSSKKISESDFNELLEVIRLAPSSFGLQPWKFVVVSNPELRQEIRKHAWNQSQIVDASHLIIFCARKNIDEEYIKNYVKHTSEIRGVPYDSLKGFEDMMLNFRKQASDDFIASWCKRQTYIPLGMLLESVALKRIDACPMEGFNPGEIDKVLGLEQEGLTSVAICALGYRSEEDKSARYKKVRFNSHDVILHK